jgi:hypothetical protein
VYREVRERRGWRSYWVTKGQSRRRMDSRE